MTCNSRFALARIAAAPLPVALVALVLLVACTGDAGSTASPQPSLTELAPTLAPSSPAGPPSPTAQPTAAQTATPALSPSAATSPSPAAGSPSPTAVGNPWQYLTDFPVDGAIEVSSVTGTPTGFVAVGYEPMPGDGYYGRRQGVVWRSADGIAWERLAPVELELASLDQVVLLNDQLYAFGMLSACPFVIDDACNDIPEAGWTVWRSADGATWTRLAQSPLLKSALLDGVIAGPGLLVAHGSTGDELTAAVWLSSDGESWEETRDLAGMDPISALTNGPNGLVAIGTQYVPSLEVTQALAAVSADGRSFQPAQLPTGLPFLFESVASTDAGYVAVGHAEDEEQSVMAAAMASADGLTWSAAPETPQFAGVRFEHVSAVPGGFVAIGSIPQDTFGLQMGSTWYSSDGLTWTEVGALPEGVYQELGAAAPGPAGMAIFATDFDEQGADVVISTVHAWFAPATGLAAR
jgi:hypothetical protein